ncbi:hypothetical protein YC2023_000546 [Brassica napus]
MLSFSPGDPSGGGADGVRRTRGSSLRFLRLIRSSDVVDLGSWVSTSVLDPARLIQPTFCLTMIDGYSFPVIKPNMHIDPLTCKVAQFNSKKHMVNERKYGKPHREFVKILCTYEDIFELRKRVEAFALQYEMHASSYQRDCSCDWMLDSASGYSYNQTNGLHYEVLDSITVTQ